jgi:hypothetical protein
VAEQLFSVFSFTSGYKHRPPPEEFDIDRARLTLAARTALKLHLTIA